MHSMFAVEVNVGESLGPPVHQKKVHRSGFQTAHCCVNASRFRTPYAGAIRRGHHMRCKHSALLQAWAQTYLIWRGLVIFQYYGNIQRAAMQKYKRKQSTTQWHCQLAYLWGNERNILKPCQLEMLPAVCGCKEERQLIREGHTRCRFYFAGTRATPPSEAKLGTLDGPAARRTAAG